MKFIVPEDEQKIVLPAHKKEKPFEIEYNNVEKFYRFDNVGVYLMKQGTKGNLRVLSTLINDGTYPSSWTIRIYNTKNDWAINVAPHDGILKEKFTVHLRQLIEEILTEFSYEISGYNTYVEIIAENRTSVEKIVNKIVEAIKGIKLEIEHPVLYLDFNMKNSSSFKVGNNYFGNNDVIDENLYRKYLKILQLLIREELGEDDRERINKVGKKLINDRKLSLESKEFIDQLSEQFISQEDRISISLTSLLE